MPWIFKVSPCEVLEKKVFSGVVKTDGVSIRVYMENTVSSAARSEREKKSAATRAANTVAIDSGAACFTNAAFANAICAANLAHTTNTVATVAKSIAFKLPYIIAEAESITASAESAAFIGSVAAIVYAINSAADETYFAITTEALATANSVVAAIRSIIAAAKSTIADDFVAADATNAADYAAKAAEAIKAVDCIGMISPTTVLNSVAIAEFIASAAAKVNTIAVANEVLLAEFATNTDDGRNSKSARLARNLRNKFGDDAALIIGNWSAPMMRYHEPIRGVGMRNMLRKHGFTTYLIDEFCTSATCPKCYYHMDTFHRVSNPRSWQRQSNPIVICHGLLRCRSQICSESVAKNGEELCYCMWNRELSAVLNFRDILFSVQMGNGIPK
ncbi:hypothetical protein IWW36_001494 [Coemansia brasiliensis]|uniref:Uncharacterized protein n=1 Tax=Coemansia brasiliensis TaxID=2650707 RepID=A0A9W8I918_9FUNG|nr:hypothetical protein IWW36_001494 [Coemansia brasiliensis]